MSEITNEAIVRCMIRQGGSFAKALGEAWVRGDAENRRRIEEGWPDYWQRYRAVVELKLKLGEDD